MLRLKTETTPPETRTFKFNDRRCTLLFKKTQRTLPLQRLLPRVLPLGPGHHLPHERRDLVAPRSLRQLAADAPGNAHLAAVGRLLRQHGASEHRHAVKNCTSGTPTSRAATAANGIGVLNGSRQLRSFASWCARSGSSSDSPSGMTSTAKQASSSSSSSSRRAVSAAAAAAPSRKPWRRPDRQCVFLLPDCYCTAVLYMVYYTRRGPVSLHGTKQGTATVRTTLRQMELPQRAGELEQLAAT